MSFDLKIFAAFILGIIFSAGCLAADQTKVQTGAAETSSQYLELISNLDPLLKQRKYVEAEPLARKAIELAPNYGPGLACYAFVLEKRGKVQEALPFYQKALELYPEGINIRLSCARLLLKEDRLEEALLHYKAAAKSEPNDAAIQYFCARTLNKLERFEEALPYCEKETSLEPKELSAWTYYGYTLAKAQNYSQALTAYQKALELDPKSANAHIGCANMMMHLDRQSEAMHIYEKAIAMAPKNEDIWLAWMHACLSSGRLEQWLSLADRFQKELPDAKALKGTLHFKKSIRQDIKQQKSPVSNYVDRMISRGVCRWKSSEFPLPVFIAPPLEAKSWKPKFDVILRQAFLDWMSASSNFVSFKIVDTRDKAKIVCQWNDTQEDIEGEGGNTLYKRNEDGSLKSALISLHTINAEFPDSPLGSDYLAEVCRHEIGHALGLSAHSDNCGDTMFAFPAEKISARDIETLRLLYEKTPSPAPK